MCRRHASTKVTLFQSCMQRCSTVFLVQSTLMLLGFVPLPTGGTGSPHSASDAGMTQTSLDREQYLAQLELAAPPVLEKSIYEFCQILSFFIKDNFFFFIVITVFGP